MKYELGAERLSYRAIIPWKVFRGKMNKQEEQIFRSCRKCGSGKNEI